MDELELDPLAVAAMVSHCGWDPLEVVTDRRVVLNGNGTTLLTLPSLRVTDVSLVEVTDPYGVSTSPTLTGAAAEVAQVQWSEDGCLEWTGCGVWPEGRRNVAVTYSGGYDVAPPDLLAALASIAKRTGGPMFGAVGRKMGTASVTFGRQFAEGDLLVVESMVFDRYRILGVA